MCRSAGVKPAQEQLNIKMLVRKTLLSKWMLPFLPLLLVACADDSFELLQGQTMGTYYAVQYDATESCHLSGSELSMELVAINDSMSTYQTDSEISRLNRSPAAQWLDVSAELAEVLRVAAEVWRRSDGAFDVTVGPLVNLWGFGPQSLTVAPSPTAQVEAAADVGMENLHIDGLRVMKDIPGLYLDLSALAKGYGVDRIAVMLAERGCLNFMVDIGGEIRVAGHNENHQLWRIGIEVPDARQMGTLQTALRLSDLSIATSGDYRNFRLVDGLRVDHVFDPRSGKPASNAVVSATVLHPSAMWADAYSTTLMVLGVEQGLRFAVQQGIPAYMMIRRVSEDKIEARYNPAMQAYLPAP